MIAIIHLMWRTDNFHKHLSSHKAAFYGNRRQFQMVYYNYARFCRSTIMQMKIMMLMATIAMTSIQYMVILIKINCLLLGNFPQLLSVGVQNCCVSSTIMIVVTRCVWMIYICHNHYYPYHYSLCAIIWCIIFNIHIKIVIDVMMIGR